MVSFLTGSLGDFLDRNYESEKVKTLFLANNVYGKHGGPYSPGTALGLLFHLLSGGEHELQGFYGHVLGGMGAITQAMAAAAREFGAEIRTRAPVARDRRPRRPRPRRRRSRTAREIAARVVVSNADPKRTFLGLVERARAARGFPPRRSPASRWTAPAPRSTSSSPRSRASHGMPREFAKPQRALFTLVPSLEFAERCYDIARLGEIPEELWVDCVVASNVDPTLAPAGRHVMTCFVQYVPYRLRAAAAWDEQRELLGDRVVRKIGGYAPNVPGSVVARQVLTPLDLERDLRPDRGQHLPRRPLPRAAVLHAAGRRAGRATATPVDGPLPLRRGRAPGRRRDRARPGHNAARQVLKDWKRRVA